ncbi:MAG: DUF4189 domain-containing protein [Alphaproteobacteria bacterium]|nr:DUF4189 domain-containing protein [Alphaproteobacteria bacterium]
MYIRWNAVLCRMVRAAAVIPVVACTCAWSAPKASAFAAIAMSECGRWGYSHGYGNKSDAWARAIRQCGARDCKIAVDVNRACGAVAMDSASRCGAKGFGAAHTRAEAERIALASCARYGGKKCTLRAWVCDGR